MFNKVLQWVGARLRERSTYVGLGMIASAVGAPALGLQIGQVGHAVVLIAGSGLMAATTKVTGGA